MNTGTLKVAAIHLDGTTVSTTRSGVLESDTDRVARGIYKGWKDFHGVTAFGCRYAIFTYMHNGERVTERVSV